MRKLRNLSIFGLAFAVLAVTLMPVSTAKASGFDYLYEPFDELNFQPVDPDAYWWVTNSGEEGGYPMLWNDLNGNGSSVSIEKQGRWNSYADLSLLTTTTEGYYTNAEISETPSGFAYNQGKWNPEYRHPVLLRTKVRWDGDFNTDGSGDAIGSSGVWLWNSPMDYMTYEFYPIDAMGISWNNDGSALVPGLNSLVMQQDWPVHVGTPTVSDMGNWLNFTMLWNEDANGNQSVQQWVNGQYLGKVDLAAPIDEGLAVQIWHDNQTYNYEGVLLETPVEDQSFQVDYLAIVQL